MGELIILIVTLIFIATIGIVTLESKNDKATCTTTKLASSSFVVCTFNEQVFFSGELK